MGQVVPFPITPLDQLRRRVAVCDSHDKLDCIAAEFKQLRSTLTYDEVIAFAAQSAGAHMRISMAAFPTEGGVA